MERKNAEKPAEADEEREREKPAPEQTTGGTGTLPDKDAPNPGFTARGG